MQRRTYMKAVLAAAAGGSLAAAESAVGKGIELHVDLTVDPGKEKEMLHNFHTTFKPAAMKQPGYRDVQLMKLQSALAGSAPTGVNYRFVLRFDSEELRQKWVASDVHQRVWPTVENTLKHKNYNVLLFNVA